MKSLYIKPESRIIIIDTDEMMQLAPASNSDLPPTTDNPGALLLPVTTDDGVGELDLCSKRFSAWDTWEDDTWEE